MSGYLVIGIVIHSSMFDRNQFRVMFDWFDFIHRCFFHSRWSCPNQPPCVILIWLDQQCIIEWKHFDCLLVCFKPILDPNLWFSDYQRINSSSLIMMLFFILFYNDTELELLFQSFIHFDYPYDYYQWTDDQI